MKKILIIKTGTTIPELISRKGDFEDMIIRGMGINYNDTLVIDVTSGGCLPEFSKISGVVITGSHEMVTDHHDWSERTAIWLRQAIDTSIPILGICYGHQLLAYSIGGQVGNNPKGPEFGTVPIILNELGIKNPLFEGLQNPMFAHVSHMQTVLKLPDHAKRLAISNGDDCQAFVIGKCAWGVQFHPEFDVDICKAYIQFCANELTDAGKNPDILLHNCTQTPEASKILNRFAAMCVK